MRKVRNADCHPDRKHYGNGLCCQCYYRKNREHIIARVQRNRNKHPGHQKNIDLKRRYGITLDEYNQLLKQQNYACYICKRPAAMGQYGVLRVDHNHQTNKVRKLLCNRCNRVLGYVGDDWGLLEKMIIYLRGIDDCKNS